MTTRHMAEATICQVDQPDVQWQLKVERPLRDRECCEVDGALWAGMYRAGWRNYGEGLSGDAYWMPPRSTP